MGNSLGEHQTPPKEDKVSPYDEADLVLTRAKADMLAYIASKQETREFAEKTLDNIIEILYRADDDYYAGKKDEAYETYRDIFDIFGRFPELKNERIHDYFNFLYRWSRIVEKEGENPIKEIDLKTIYKEARKELKNNRGRFSSFLYSRYSELFCEYKVGQTVTFKCFDGSIRTMTITDINGDLLYGVSNLGRHWCLVEDVIKSI